MATAIATSLSTQRQAIQLLPKRALRVLTVTPFYPSQQNPASGCFIAEPLLEMKTHAVETDIIAVQPFYRDGARAISAEVSAKWHKYFSFPGNFGLPFTGTFAARSLIGQLREMHSQHAFHLIHAHSALPCGAAAMSLSQRLGIPFVVTVHGLDAYSTRQAGPVVGRWCESISKRVYESASAVICISDKVRGQVAQAADARTVVVYNGVDTSLFSPGPELSPLRILSVGNLILSKGHATLLQAFARIQPANADCAVEIIGAGPQRNELRHLAAKLGIADRVRFLGRQTRDEVAEAMRRCAVFALPSSYEGLGCVYLEAMASGKPAIGCKGQGIDEIVESGKNGFLVAPESESELAETLIQLLRDKRLRQALGMSAREAVLKRHSIARQAAELAEVYRESAR